jgi:hypothetical protein
MVQCYLGKTLSPMDRIAPTEVAYILGLFLTMVYGGWRREGIHGCNHVWSAVVVFAVFVWYAESCSRTDGARRQKREIIIQHVRCNPTQVQQLRDSLAITLVCIILIDSILDC